MARKKIDGAMAGHLMNAVEHLAKLGLEMAELRWDVCWHDGPIHAGSIPAHKAKTHCRKLMQELELVIHRLDHGEEDDRNAEQERAIRAVK